MVPFRGDNNQKGTFKLSLVKIKRVHFKTRKLRSLKIQNGTFYRGSEILISHP